MDQSDQSTDIGRNKCDLHAGNSGDGPVLVPVEPNGFSQAHRVIWPNPDEPRSGWILITRPPSPRSNSISPADVAGCRVSEFSVKRRNMFSGVIGMITGFSMGGTTPLVVLPAAASLPRKKHAHDPTTGRDRPAIPPRYPLQSRNPGSCPVSSPTESPPLRKFWTIWRRVGSGRADTHLPGCQFG